jgi:hypothetical protein
MEKLGSTFLSKTRCTYVLLHTALTAVPNVSISFSYSLDRMQELYLN